MSLPLPKPKDIALQLASMVDSLMDMIEQPARNIATQLGIPIPERPRLTDMVAQLPDVEDIINISIPSPIPMPTARQEVEKASREARKAVSEAKAKVEQQKIVSIEVV